MARGKKTGVPSNEVPRTDESGREAIQAFMVTGCAEHVRHLQDTCAALRTRAEALEQQVLKLKGDLGKCYGQRTRATAALRLRATSELAVLQRVKRETEGLMAQALVEGELLVANAPRYEEEEEKE